MSRLLSKTKELLEASELDAAQIAIGARVNINWLQGIRYNKKLGAPAVDKIERLYEFLSGKPLEL